jgi:peroxiredoxin Q/BCP
MTKVTVGDPAPDFTLPDHRGNDVTLSGFFGDRNVVLYFYPRDFSPGCTAQACHFRDNYEDFTDIGAVVIGVSGDSPESHERFIEEHLLPFILLSDGDNEVRKLYGATKGLGLLPGRVTYIIDKKGVLRHVFTSEIDMRKHIDEALRILRKLSEES